jgi:acetylornithine deacetylase/succinyl-diaminopimelate desuccinylase-like protein
MKPAPPGEYGDDRRYGGDPTDTKGPLAAMSRVLEALVETDRRSSVDIAFASDEETGRSIAVYARIPATYDETVD